MRIDNAAIDSKLHAEGYRLQKSNQAITEAADFWR